jgi:hypothetical protein
MGSIEKYHTDLEESKIPSSLFFVCVQQKIKFQGRKKMARRESRDKLRRNDDARDYGTLSASASFDAHSSPYVSGESRSARDLARGRGGSVSVNPVSDGGDGEVVQSAYHLLDDDFDAPGARDAGDSGSVSCG